jgi:hypothetical protein
LPDNPSGQIGTVNGVGALRWTVMLYRRDQAPGANSAIGENLVLIATVHADIQPTYPSTFYNSAQIDTPITHLIRTRWLDYVENVYVIMRTTTRPSDGTNRTEIFRIRRVKEVGGRKRFTEYEAELERIDTTTGDGDPERESLFAEGGGALASKVLH